MDLNEHTHTRERKHREERERGRLSVPAFIVKPFVGVEALKQHKEHNLSPHTPPILLSSTEQNTGHDEQGLLGQCKESRNETCFNEST